MGEQNLHLDRVTFGYHPESPVIAEVELTISEGTLTAILGRNGSGKSTLLRLLSGNLKPQRGRVRLGELELTRIKNKEKAKRIAYLPQHEPADVPFTALELVLMGRFAYQGLLPFDRLEDLEIARKCLDQVEAGAFANRLLVELSGGERQRVHLARALAQAPDVLLLDEPAASLDIHHQVEIYRLLRRLNEAEGKTIVLVSHDLNLPASFADRIIVLDNGGIYASGPPSEILRAKVLEPVYRTRILETRSEELGHPILTAAP